MPEAKRSSRPANPDAPATLTMAGPAVGAEVFLSPRVIDREAFNDYAGSLRTLIEQAGDRGQSLRQATGEAEAAHQQLKDLATKHTARFELAAKAMAALDERAGKAEKMLIAVQQAALSLDAFREDAARIVNQAVAGCQARLDESLAAVMARSETAQARADARAQEALARVAALEERLAAMDQRIEQEAAQRLASAEARIEESMSRLQSRLSRLTVDAETRLSDARTECEEVVKRIDTLGTGLDGKLAECRQTISAMEARAVQSIEDAAAGARRNFDGVCEAMSNHAEELRLSLAAGAEIHRERLDQAGDAARRRADEAASQVAAAADAAGAQAEDHHERLADLLIRIEESAGEAEALMGLAQSLPDEADAQARAEAERTALPGSLAALVLRARRCRGDAENALRQLEATGKQTEQARSILGSSLLEAADRIDALTARADELTARVAQSLATATEAGVTLERRRDELAEAAAGPLAELQARGDDLRRQTDAMETQAKRAREITREVVEQTTHVVRGLSATLAQLKPWQPLLLEDDPASADAPLPPALQRVVDQVRADIAGDLGAVAAGLSQLANRAQRSREAAHAPARSV